MAAIEQSVSAWCFERTMSPQNLARTLAEIGFAGVDLVDQAHWPLFKEHGLVITAVNGHRSIEDGLNRRENHDRIEREISANLDLAARWGIPNLIVFSGNRAGLDDATGAEITAEGLRRVAGAAEDAGVTLVLELLNSKVDHPDYQADHTAWGVRVCELVGSPRVKLLYDIYHMQIMEGDIIRTIRDNASYIGHYHTAGNPGRHEIGAAQELSYPAIMRAILATGYDGYVGQEFIPAGDPVAALREAFNLCKG
jgi:hydroxypyruvate isomerase